MIEVLQRSYMKEKNNYETSLAKQLARRGLTVNRNSKSRRVEAVFTTNTDLKDDFQFNCEGHTVTAIDTYMSERSPIDLRSQYLH